MSTEEHQVILCECGEKEHQFILTMFDWDGDIDVYLEPHLVTYRNFFKRVWVAIRYVFGYRCKYGEFDCVELGEEQLHQMRDFITKVFAYIVNNNKANKC